MELCTPVECIKFTNAFFAIVHIMLALMLMYCWHKFIVAKTVWLHSVKSFFLALLSYQFSYEPSLRVIMWFQGYGKWGLDCINNNNNNNNKMTYTRLEQQRGNIHTNGAHKSNNDNTTSIFIGLHKTIQKNKDAARRR